MTKTKAEEWLELFFALHIANVEKILREKNNETIDKRKISSSIKPKKALEFIFYLFDLEASGPHLLLALWVKQNQRFTNFFIFHPKNWMDWLLKSFQTLLYSFRKLCKWVLKEVIFSTLNFKQRCWRYITTLGWKIFSFDCLREGWILVLSNIIQVSLDILFKREGTFHCLDILKAGKRQKRRLQHVIFQTVFFALEFH